LNPGKEKAKIKTGERTYLGIELGSTRIKAVLTDENHIPIASGTHTWENRLVDGLWTYSLEDIWYGLRACYASLAADYREKSAMPLTRVDAIGVSAMMHGYLAFDGEGELLVPFRTWRNTNTAEAAKKLSELFSFNIPQRWSVAHLYQALLDGEAHVPFVRRLNTLAGYIHFRLTGERVLGVGDASGMFPIDSEKCDYNSAMLEKFDLLTEGLPWRLRDLLPRVLCAGESAGVLTEDGARALDPSGKLQSGIPFCPPEGDAGTGMAATNSVSPQTGNVSAGTSVFLMAVLEKSLTGYHEEIDMVTTPSGEPVAMVHCNNCSGEIDAWVRLFGEAARALGADFDINTLYSTLFRAALEGEPDGGGLLAYNYLSGEPVTGFKEGRPLYTRRPDSELNLSNFMRAQLYSACATLRIGMETLWKEGVTLKSLTGHGGFFKTKGVGQSVMSAALNVPVTVTETSGEGGPWGMALLASYMRSKETGQTLADYLKTRVFDGSVCCTIEPKKEDAAGFSAFLTQYKAGLSIEKAAVEALHV